MKRIAKKICSTVCALLALSGNRGGTLTKEALHLTKEILCNAGQWLACWFNGKENNVIFDEFGKKLVPVAIGAATIANAVDAAKRSYDIAHDVIKGSKNKPDTTNKKESKNYWPISETIFGVSNILLAFGHAHLMRSECEKFCKVGILHLIVSSMSLTDAYFRFRGSNQSNESQIQKKEEATQPNQMSSNPKNSKNSEIYKK